MSIKYFIIGGFPQSGKSLFVEQCRQLLGYEWSMDLSTIDLVKQLAIEAGWDGSKTPENRKFLSDLKQLLIKWRDVPYYHVIKRAESQYSEMQSLGIKKDLFVFVQCREPTEIQKFVDRNNAYTIFIQRKEHEAPTNKSDIETTEYDYKYIIQNEGTIEDLKSAAKTFLSLIHAF